MGAYPDQWGSNATVFDRSVANQSSLMGLVSVHVPLAGTSQTFDCNALLKDAQIRARLDNLRELLDENLITEAQYREVVLRLYQPILNPKDQPLPNGLGEAKRLGDVRLSGTDRLRQPFKANRPQREVIPLTTLGELKPDNRGNVATGWPPPPPPVLPSLPGSGLPTPSGSSDPILLRPFVASID
ncbi:MAG: hypothetical protein QUV07_00600 [Cyanobium sp. CZS 25K]|nr:hypothetical protein [Cyanobium sp. CZS25K]